MNQGFAMYFTRRFMLAAFILGSSGFLLTAPAQEDDQVVSLPGSDTEKPEWDRDDLPAPDPNDDGSTPTSSSTSTSVSTQPARRALPVPGQPAPQPRPEPSTTTPGSASAPRPRPTPPPPGAVDRSTSRPNPDAIPDVQRTTEPLPQSMPDRIPEGDRRQGRNELKFEESIPEGDGSIRVGKIHEYVNAGESNQGNEALRFESKYWNWGAITNQDRQRKRGHYFVFNWKSKGGKRNLVARFEYRQTKSADTVRTLTLRHPNASGHERSTFAVAGDAYRSYGEINGWRFTILDENGQILGGKESFVW